MEELIKPTFEEDINYNIMTYIDANNNDADFLFWYKKYGEDCDKIIFGMYNRKSTEIDWLNNKQKEAWYNIPKGIREQIIDMIRARYDSGVLSSGPRECKYMVKHIEKLIPLRNELIKEMRNARDNGSARLLLQFSGDSGKQFWNEASQEEKDFAKESWLSLVKITIPMNQSVIFVNNCSPEYWKKLTKQWIDESGIKLY